MKIPYNILIQIKMSVRPYFKGFTLIFFFYNCRKQDFNTGFLRLQSNYDFHTISVIFPHFQFQRVCYNIHAYGGWSL